VSSSPGGTETILLVEDDADVRALARESLRRYGYTVLEARDALEAMRLAEAAAAPVDLLMTDVVLPEMGGAELARRLGDRWPGLRVLFVSGYAPEAVARHGILPAGSPFLAKPFTLSSLARRVREALDVGATASGAARHPH
jgi:CheY-like chemotaxis protein